MSDTNDNNSISAAGSGKSPEEVAFELVNKLKGQGVWGERNVDAILDMYAKCLDATKGLRAYEGQNRVDVPIKAPVATQPVQEAQAPEVQSAPPVQPVQAQAPQVQAPPMQAQPVPSQPVQAATQPVHAQQQQIQQAYKQA